MRPASPVFVDACLPEVVFAKDQPEYIPLPAVRLIGDEGQIVTRWELSDDDRARIAAGASVYLSVRTFGRPLQPVLLETTPPSVVPAPPSAWNDHDERHWPSGPEAHELVDRHIREAIQSQIEVDVYIKGVTNG